MAAMSDVEQSHDDKPTGLEPSLTGEGAATECAQDAVFGEMSEDGPNYRNVRDISSCPLILGLI